jgi:hypothetical protein
LKKIEKQKNKDYYEKSNNNLKNHSTSLYNNYQLINANDLSRFISNSFSKPSLQSGTKSGSKNQTNLSKDSNKDSGFHQEFIYDNNNNRSFVSNEQHQQKLQQHLLYHQYQQDQKNDSLKPNDNKLLCSDLSELSLL